LVLKSDEHFEIQFPIVVVFSQYVDVLQIAVVPDPQIQLF